MLNVDGLPPEVLQTKGTLHARGTLKWRKAERVELTEERLTPLTGFEARPHHRMRLPSIGWLCAIPILYCLDSEGRARFSSVLANWRWA